MRKVLFTIAGLFFMLTHVCGQEFVLKEFPHNSRNVDFGVYFHNDTFIFCSNRKHDFINEVIDEQTEERLFNYYYSVVDKKGNWSKPRPYSKHLTSDYHEGPLAFYDENTIYFTRSIIPEGNDRSKRSNLGIFIVRRQGEAWSNPEPFQWNDKKSSTAHPTFTPDRKRMFFVSDNKEGEGKSDIYYVDKTPEGWSEPVNLGAEINSRKRELFPYYHVDGTLYFSTDGRSTRNLSIYATKFEDGVWQIPERIERPFSSEYDDYAFIISESNKYRFFTTNKKNNRDNIYIAEYATPEMESCDSIEDTYFCYEFYDMNQQYDDENFKLEWEIEGEIIKGDVVEYCFEDTGIYEVSLHVEDILKGVRLENEANYLIEIAYPHKPFISSPDVVFANETIPFDANRSFIPQLKNKTYFWEIDGIYLYGKEIEYKFNEPGEYRISLEIKGEKVYDEGEDSFCTYKIISVN